jgi:uncharacterized membrane protein YhaH (DUF805 family)
VSGLLLALLKFAIDTAIVFAATGKTWSPLGYLVPSIALRSEGIGSAPQAMHFVLVGCALPFLWVGLSMSVRRAADAGIPPWMGLAFAVPIVNYLVIVLLCILPTSARASWVPQPASPYRRAVEGELPPAIHERSGVRAALVGLLASIGIGTAMLWLCVFGLGTYGTALFFVTPFAMGVVSSIVYNFDQTRPLGRTIVLSLAGTAMTGCVFLLFALEGVMCLAMAFPMAAVIATVGSVIAHTIVSYSRKPRAGQTAAMLVVLPAIALGEAKVSRPTPRDVTTSIEVNAPPEAVWPNVIGFSELPPPPEWFFRLGIAYPMRARIAGVGVGAVRHCEFSTGPFVEPITVWDPPRRLAFDVTSQPPSMTEMSPYRAINAPHLEGYLVSRGGEFRLTALPGGRTRIEGTTHYTLAFSPETYWAAYAELLLHAIHGRVLSHIKRLSEHVPAAQ